nr:reverse transcriptase domain-containing protein [Tanacetum cinerariifolium]
MDLKTQLETVAKKHQASIQNLETKFDRLGDKQSGRPSRSLPSNTQPNPKGHNSKAYQLPQARNEHMNAMFTRSGYWNSPEYQDIAGSKGKKVVNALNFYRMEIRQDTIERMEYRQSYHWGQLSWSKKAHAKAERSKGIDLLSKATLLKEDYVPTDDEMNDDSNDINKEEYERINEELYGDVNVTLTDDEPAGEEKDDEEMNVDGNVNINQEGACNQVKDDAQATHKTEVPLPSSSISSDYAAKFLNFDNIPPADTEVIFMLDINVQHEVPRISSLLTIPMFIISEQDSAQAEDTVFKAGDTQGIQNLGEDTCNTNEPPVVNVDPKDWFKKPKRPSTPDPE